MAQETLEKCILRQHDESDKCTLLWRICRRKVEHCWLIDIWFVQHNGTSRNCCVMCRMGTIACEMLGSENRQLIWKYKRGCC